jgi:hypothetical protein
METGAMYKDTEYPIWKRSFRSSPSKITPCTWRREAVVNLIQTKENV